MTRAQLTWTRILVALVVVGISIYIYSLRDQADKLAVYGYPGIFILSFLAYATVFLPAPGLAIIATMGAVFNPFLVALVAASGATLGEVAGYLAGFSGQMLAERVDIYDRLTIWMRRNGPLTVYLLAAIPNPFFDIAGVIAGVLKMSLLTFLVSCWLGETTKMLAFAFLGFQLLK